MKVWTKTIRERPLGGHTKTRHLCYSLGKRRILERRELLLIDQLQLSTNSDKLSGRLCAVVSPVRLSTGVDPGHAVPPCPGGAMAPAPRYPGPDRARYRRVGGVLE